MTTVGLTPDEQAELEALAALAQREHRAGRLAEAAAAYARLLALRPDVAEAHNNLGNVLQDLGRLDEAAAQFEQAIALRPDLAAAHNNLGGLRRGQGRLDEAEFHYRQAVALRPDLAGMHNNLGIVLKEQGKLDQAVARYRQTIALMPDHAEAHNNLANALSIQGKLDEAAGHYERAIALRPDYVEAYYDRGDLKTYRAGDADLVRLEALAVDPGRLPAGKRVCLHFALAKALDDVGDDRRTFEHWLQGNALRRLEVDYNEAAHLETFRRIADTFDGSLFERFRGAGDPSPIPIFIVGMPRSASTLVEQILASHPQVHAAGELTNLDRVVRAATNAIGQPIPFPQSVRTFDADGLRRMGQAYRASLPTPVDGKQRISDKAPANFLYVGLIRLILPHARIIHTVRDPVDTCLSCFSRLFTTGPAFHHDLAQLGRYYRGYHELMEHWRRVLPAGSLLDVAYEDVVDNLEDQARRLIDFCGLPWDDRCLRFHETRRPVATASKVQVRRPLYRSSVARWRRYEAYLEPLLAELASCRRPADRV